METNNPYNPIAQQEFSPDHDLNTQSWEITESLLEGYAQAHALPVPEETTERILHRLQKEQYFVAHRHPLDPYHLPDINAHSNWLDWEVAVQHIPEPEQVENVFLHPLESTPERDLFVAWVRQEVPEEVHHDILESFLILKGSCICHITNPEGEQRTVRLGPGETITMQTGEQHTITITSREPAKAILQWKKNIVSA